MKNQINYIFLIAILCTLWASCGTHKSTTVFNKRHYRNGYNLSRIGKVPNVEKKTQTTATEIINNTDEENSTAQARVNKHNEYVVKKDKETNESKSSNTLSFSSHTPKNKIQKLANGLASTQLLAKPSAQLKKLMHSVTKNDTSDDLSLFWIVILVLLLLWFFGFLGGGWGVGGLINILLVIALILLILWLLRIV